MLMVMEVLMIQLPITNCWWYFYSNRPCLPRINSGSKTVTLTANGTPGHLVQNGRTSDVTMIVNAVPAAPTNITTQTRRCLVPHREHNLILPGYTDNQTGVGIGDWFICNKIRYNNSNCFEPSNIDGSESGTLNSDSNTAAINPKAFTATGDRTFDDSVITSEGDAHDEISSNTYPSDHQGIPLLEFVHLRKLLV